jgi:hypothetical protein
MNGHDCIPVKLNVWILKMKFEFHVIFMLRNSVLLFFSPQSFERTKTAPHKNDYTILYLEM